nr:type VI secretion system tube protein Hcp [uncultured Lichenicoccus sp.]
MAIYCKFGSFKGDVAEEGHKNWIELQSFQWGIGRGVSNRTGSGADREASAPSISEITVTKNQDSASIKLLQEALIGTGAADAATVQIDFTRTDKTQSVYETLTLSNVIISGYSTSSGGDRPSESLSFNFTKIEVKITPMEATGQAGGGATVTYDLQAAKTT